MNSINGQLIRFQNLFDVYFGFPRERVKRAVIISNFSAGNRITIFSDNMLPASHGLSGPGVEYVWYIVWMVKWGGCTAIES
jgi:hypothetical protein